MTAAVRDRPKAASRLAGLGMVVDDYAALFCDVFGVLHDADRTHTPAVEALVRARERGLVVVLVSNSALTAAALQRTLVERGLPAAAWDAVVTSADLARAMLRDRGISAACHIGPTRDRSLFEGLDLVLAEAARAEIVVCTGVEHPPDDVGRTASLKVARERDLDLVCTNPDLTAVANGRTLRFAGVVAAQYRQIGGTVLSTGKPDQTMYRHVMEVAATIAGRPIAPGRILAVGDTYGLDIVGARRHGLDALWITASVDVEPSGDGPTTTRWMPELAW